MAATPMTKPINTIYGFQQKNQRVIIWMQHDNHLRIEGRLVGYDEFLNVVLEDAVESDTRKPGESSTIGKILLKGDNIGLIHAVGSA